MKDFVSFDFTKLPKEEQPLAQHVWILGRKFFGHRDHFAAAILLRRFAEIARGPMMGQAGITIHHWIFIAARDAAMSIYHAGRAIESIRENFRSCPTLRGLVDHNMLREAFRQFKSTFPDYISLRHAMTHMVEFAATPERILEHARRHPDGGASSGGGSLGGATGDTFGYIFEGRDHSFEFNEVSLTLLNQVAERIASAFENVKSHWPPTEDQASPLTALDLMCRIRTFPDLWLPNQKNATEQ